MILILLKSYGNWGKFGKQWNDKKLIMAKNKKQLRKEAFNTGKEIEAMKRFILHRFIASSLAGY